VKGYYKNWYQHYLELEKQKEKEVQRGYYSNLTRSENKAENRIPARLQGEKSKVPEGPLFTRVKKKKKFKLFSVLLPISTILGFIFLWYQMDIGPIRSLAHEVLGFAGIRQEVVDVVSYHINLLDQHIAFAEKVAVYLTSEDEADFESLQLIYDEIRINHIEVAKVSGDDYKEVIRLWPFMLSNTSQMMRELITVDDVEVAHKQFISTQEEIEAMIRNALGVGEEI
jgi:hypothetical protein